MLHIIKYYLQQNTDVSILRNELYITFNIQVKNSVTSNNAHYF
jgi:hypothetical protein